MTLEYWQASHEIEKFSHAIGVLSKGLDNLWPRLSEDAMRKLSAIRELEAINNELADRIRNIAESIQAEGDEKALAEGDLLECLSIVSGTVDVPHHGEVR